VTIAYERRGSGSPLVLLHGIGHRWQAWEPVLFAELGLDRPHVVGNSLGGALALELAAAGHVASATALAPAGFWNSAEKGYALAVLLTHRALSYLPESLVTPFLRTPRLRRLSCSMLYGRPELLDPAVPYDDLRGLRYSPGFNRVAWASRGYRYTGRPVGRVTVAWGSKDRILLPRQAGRARSRLPDARHVWLPGCGHLPMHDAPDLVAQVILGTTGG
jgi:pimeloyl-ACP methyl ester carboxylesterase